MNLQISPEAKRDLLAIKEYIKVELENPTAAVNTVSRITKAIRKLSDFPGIGAPLSSVIDIHTEYRYLVSGNYLVFYWQENDNVYIARVLYGKRDYIRILFKELHEG